jgi:large subunit ribosomal protein L23
MGIIDKLTKSTPKKPAVKKAKAVEASKDLVVKPAGVTVVQSASSGSLNVIVKPLVTEKSAIMQSNNKYVFAVAGSANKQQIAQAVKELYGVKPVAVNVINTIGHKVRSGKSAGKRSDFKKAIITLKPGEAITVHAGV